jgi:hypothetical protein
MFAATASLLNWFPQFTQAMSGPVALVLWGGVLTGVSVMLRSRFSRPAVAAGRPEAAVRRADRGLRSKVVQPVEG